MVERNRLSEQQLIEAELIRREIARRSQVQTRDQALVAASDSIPISQPTAPQSFSDAPVIQPQTPVSPIPVSPPSQDPRPRAQAAQTVQQEFERLPTPGQSSQVGQQIGASALAEAPGRIAGAAAGTALSPLLGPLAPLGPGIGAMVGGMVGGGAAFTAVQLSRGEDIKPGEVAMEMGLSAIPDAIARPVSALAEGIVRGTARGREELSNLGARFLRERAPGFFAPLPKERLDAMFEAVRQSGDRLAPTSMTRGLKLIPDKQFDASMRVLRRIESPPGKRSGIGDGAADLFTRIRSGQPAAGMDLGSLQHVRSQLTQRAAKLSAGDTRDAVNEVIETIDDAIAGGRFMSGGEGRPLLAQARREWARFKDAEDFQALVLQSGITAPSAGGKSLRLNLGKLEDAINNPTTKVQQRAVGALNRNSEAKADVLSFIGKMKQVNIDKGDLEDFQVAGLVTKIIRQPLMRARFNRLVNETRGPITVNQLATVVNVGRRAGQDQGLIPGGPNRPRSPGPQPGQGRPITVGNQRFNQQL